MKRRILAALSAVAALALAFAFTACKDEPEPEPVDDESFSYSEINSYEGIAGYEITGLSGDAAEAPEKLNIPATYKGKPVLAIGESAFYANENLKSVTIGSKVTDLGELAFADCPALETVVLGESVKNIGGYAFSQCLNLKDINLPQGLETIGECSFVGCVSLKAAVLPEGLKSMGDCAFAGCSRIQSFIIPDSVTQIGWGVVMFNSGSVGFQPAEDTSNSLTEITVSNSLTEIPDFAFSKANISSVKIGSRVETIRYSAFYGCEMMESVIIPQSVKKVESYAFYRCTALQGVYYEGTEEEWGEITVGNNGNDITSVTMYYYSATRPSAGGYFWHYVNGKPVNW